MWVQNLRARLGVETWLHDEKEKSGGGIYLFEEEVSVKAYLDREIVAGILSHPAISDTGAKVFDVILERSKIT